VHVHRIAFSDWRSGDTGVRVREWELREVRRDGKGGSLELGCVHKPPGGRA